MKTFGKRVAIVLLGGLSLSGFNARAIMEIGASVQIRAKTDFDTPLAIYGGWVEARSYGRCWHPARRAVDWRPYCAGQWVWTDSGWYWQSDEPWAWACYHYGRWVYDSDQGWLWVPDIEWAPAWVYWRTGGAYIGWAPCPPAGVYLDPGFFAFVEVGHFRERVSPRAVIVNNPTIINQTKEINNIRYEARPIEGRSQKLVVNEGPGIEGIQRATGKNIRSVPIQEAARRAPAPDALMAKQALSPRQEKSRAPMAHPEPPPNENLRSPIKVIPSKAPPTEDRIPRTGERDSGHRLTPPGGPANPSAAPQAKPAGPPAGNGGQGPRNDKRQDHDRDKP